MTKSESEPSELPVASVQRWECVRAWGQVMLCMHGEAGETRVYALSREAAAALGAELQDISWSDPVD